MKIFASLAIFYPRTKALHCPETEASARNAANLVAFAIPCSQLRTYLSENECCENTIRLILLGCGIDFLRVIYFNEFIFCFSSSSKSNLSFAATNPSFGFN